MDRKILEPHHAVEKRDLYRSVLPIYTVDRASLQRHTECRIRGSGRHIFTIGMCCTTYRMIALCTLCFALSVQDPPPYSVQHAQELETMEMTFTSSASAGGCCLLTLLDKSTVDVRNFENLCGNHM